MILVRQIEAVSAEISALDTALRNENKASELGPRLETIPSIGPVIASALRARVTDAKLFENGRHLSAWIGLVPENDSPAARSGKMGFPRRVIAICAHYSLTARWPSCARRSFARIRIPGSQLLGRMSAKQAAIAIANKTARIAWAIMVYGGVYEAGHRPAHDPEACAATG